MKNLMLTIVFILLSTISNAMMSLNQLELSAHKSGIKFEQFEKLTRYLNKYSDKIENKNYVSFIDFNLPSSQERLFVINLNTGEIKKYLVAHGINSGENTAESFSNTEDSKKSSLGLYKVENEYSGEHGRSLILDGLEQSNSNARERSIVLHSANYVSHDYIRQYGRIGRSFGCPATNPNDWKNIIDKVKNGSLLLIYK